MDSRELESIDTVTLSAGTLQAQFAPALGMAGVSLRHEGEELLDRQAGLLAYARTGAVMGVPLLYPWANRLAGHDYMLDGRDVRLPFGPPLVHCEEHGLPIHGLLHASPHWRTTSQDETRIRAMLDFGAHPELLAAFPFPHTLEIEASLSVARLRIVTTVRPTSAAAVPIAFGFHPYLRLPDVPRAGWQVTLPPRRRLILDPCGIPTGAGERQPATRFGLDDRDFDDGYDGLGSRSAFSVSGGGRTITVELESGYPAAQVFSPRGEDFICFEPMTAPTNALRSGAGLRRAADEFTASFSIAVGQLPPERSASL
ncbi:MAG TPA: aldose 1-epimerase [Solirubrobacteraceae bacterium]|nr:aldose 1-epimerase [Solirubrobacteraceae bacterium]